MTDKKINPEWAAVGKTVLIIATGESMYVCGFYGTDHRVLAFPGDDQSPFVTLHLSEIVPGVALKCVNSASEDVPRETSSSMDNTDPVKLTNPKDAVAANKLPLHLVSPIVKAYQAIAHFLGSVKYGAWNYRAAGARASVYKSALDGHINAWWEGEEYDPTDGTPHLANALACLGILIDAKHSGGLVDDRPPSMGSELARVRAEFEAMMPIIRARYADRKPHHFSIEDKKS